MERAFEALKNHVDSNDEEKCQNDSFKLPAWHDHYQRIWPVYFDRTH